jgi:hypothetical protein
MDLRFSGKSPEIDLKYGQRTILSEACLHLRVVTLLINFEKTVVLKRGSILRVLMIRDDLKSVGTLVHLLECDKADWLYKLQRA